MSEVPRTQFQYEQSSLDKSPATSQGKSKGLSIVALVLGLASLTPATFLAGIPAIIVSTAALWRRRPGRGMAYTGLVTGVFGTLVLTFVMLLPLIARQRELHRVAVVKQNMLAYRAALDDFATENEGRYPKPGISWEKEDEDGMVLHFKADNGFLTSIPFNPYTHERYRKGRDFFYQPEDLAETELNALVDPADPRCPYVGLAAPGGVPGTIVVLGWAPPEFSGSPIEYAVVGYGRNTAEPLRTGRSFFILHN
jgi:hypothetical protein